MYIFLSRLVCLCSTSLAVCPSVSLSACLPDRLTDICMCIIVALIIRIRSCGPLYSNYNKETQKKFRSHTVNRLYVIIWAPIVHACLLYTHVHPYVHTYVHIYIHASTHATRSSPTACYRTLKQTKSAGALLISAAPRKTAPKLSTLNPKPSTQKTLKSLNPKNPKPCPLKLRSQLRKTRPWEVRLRIHRALRACRACGLRLFLERGVLGFRV